MNREEVQFIAENWWVIRYYLLWALSSFALLCVVFSIGSLLGGDE
jgi:hypothetical protein